ncbi:hypothetical protein T310_7009, partial [Rasamsonia emersonii CBS 393.64]
GRPKENNESYQTANSIRSSWKLSLSWWIPGHVLTREKSRRWCASAGFSTRGSLAMRFVRTSKAPLLTEYHFNLQRTLHLTPSGVFQSRMISPFGGSQQRSTANGPHGT